MLVDVVIPTAGRPSLATLLAALEPQRAGLGRIIVAEDTAGRGPAATRNEGWRQSGADWVAFLDDDVVPGPEWVATLLEDLAGCEAGTWGSQGRIVVPLPGGRRPTDWERNVAGLETAQWATADLAYRRVALERVGGFDERFPRAYREDADLGLRMVAAGGRIVPGRRVVRHPVGPAGPAVSLRKQAGNADDALMDALHGRGWRERAGAPAGRRGRHAAVTAAAALAVAAPRRSLRRASALAWAAGTAELAWARIAPGPRTPREVATMALTSALMAPLATGWWLAGKARARRLVSRPPAAVLFDRDGTLVVDVPYNGDPERVELVPGAREAVARLRRAGVPTGVVSNQSGIARGMLTRDDVDAVNARVEELIGGGPLGPWAYCPHGPEEGCACRKPAPGLVLEAAARLGVDPAACVVIGDIGADVGAARAAGARGILVPTPRTRREEVEEADEVAADLVAAVELVLS
jgi:histidinol-phosphate phosphatase family protein